MTTQVGDDVATEKATLGHDDATEKPTRVHDDPKGSPKRLRARRMLQAVLYAGPVVGFLGAGFANRWITDDGFIYLRVVQQIRAGNGPVFNEGERVEAFTGTLWLALLTVGDLVTPVRLEWLAVLLGLACGAAGLALAIAGARRLATTLEDGPWFVPLGALVFVAITPVWVFATGGLETGLVFGWLGACLWVLATWARTPQASVSLGSAVLLGLGWLIRPELVVFSAAFLAIVLAGEWRQCGHRRRAAVITAALALPVAYQLFRMGYYGSLLSNTAVAKESGSTNWERGWRYARDFADAYWLWIPLVGLVAGGYLPLASVLRRSRARLTVAAFAGCGVLHAVYMIKVGGDYLHARLLLPGLFALCAPVAVVPVTRRHVAALVVAPWAVAAVFALRPAQYGPGGWFANLLAMPTSHGRVTADDFGWGEDSFRRTGLEGAAVYYEVSAGRYGPLDIDVRRDVDLPVGVFGAVGLVSYAMGPEFHVLDILGLADPFTAHLDPTPAVPTEVPGLAGHEKPIPLPWLVAFLTPPGSRPDVSPLLPARSRLLATTTDAELQEQLAWARAALRCPEIVKITNAARAPLTAGRVADNLLRSFQNTRVRIPADPEEAYHQFCGDGTPPEVRDLHAG